MIALAVLATVVLVRFAWVMTYNTAARLKARWIGPGRWPGTTPPTVNSGLVVSWCGMRGVVTLAAAYALPVAADGSAQFPHRDLILLCAFSVVVGTLVLQGLTLRPLIAWLGLKDDGEVEHEVHIAHKKLVRIGLAALDGNASPEALALRDEFSSILDDAQNTGGVSGRHAAHNDLRVHLVARQRQTLFEMRASGEIGDDAFHEIEARLDWAELNARGPSATSSSSS